MERTEPNSPRADHSETQIPRWYRRWLAMIYELLPLFAIAFAVTVPLVGLMPQDHVPAGSWWYQALLLLIVGLYFVSGWIRGGQTLGMRPWRLFVISADGSSPSLGQAAIRYAVALLGWLPAGLGHWWMLFDRQGRTWHDLAAGTRVVHRTPD